MDAKIAVIPWEEKYALGVEDIDLQHHYFLNLINRIGEEVSRTDDQRYIKSLISELDAYARFHFISEETMMLHAAYPEYEEHKKHHLDLLQRLSVEQYKLLNFKDEKEFEKAISFLREWFLHHTNEEDRKFAYFLGRGGRSQ